MPPELSGSSPVVRMAADVTRAAAASDGPVLIVTEPGFSAERVALAVHAGGPRAALPFVRVDCADPPALVLQRLFGTSAPRAGDRELVAAEAALARADAGSVFLLGVDEMPAAAQIRLSRVLRDGEFRVEGTTVPARFRLLASSRPGLDADVQERRFRPELYRRLQRLRVHVPPLRDRPQDLPSIIRAAFAEVCSSSGREGRLAPAAVTALAALRWPGNLDELRDCLVRLVHRSDSGLVRQEDVLADLEQARVQVPQAPASLSLREARLSFERDYIARVLEAQGWRMAEAARVLGIERANLYRKTRQLGISRPRRSRES